MVKFEEAPDHVREQSTSRGTGADAVVDENATVEEWVVDGDGNAFGFELREEIPWSELLNIIQDCLYESDDGGVSYDVQQYNVGVLEYKIVDTTFEQPVEVFLSGAKPDIMDSLTEHVPEPDELGGGVDEGNGNG